MSVEYISAKLCLFSGNPAHWCPGCEELHRFYVNWPNPGNQARWTFNGDNLKPTFNPSMLIKIGTAGEEDYECCHYFLKQGILIYQADTTHKFKSHSIDLPDIPPKWPAYKNRLKS